MVFIHPLDLVYDPLTVTQAPTWLYFQIPPFHMPISLNPITFTYFSNPRVYFRLSLSLELFSWLRSKPSTWLPELGIQNANLAVPRPYVKTLQWLHFIPRFKFQFFGVSTWSSGICPCPSLVPDVPPPHYIYCALYTHQEDQTIRGPHTPHCSGCVLLYTLGSPNTLTYRASDPEDCAGGLSSWRSSLSSQRGTEVFSLAFSHPPSCHLILLFTFLPALMVTVGRSLRARAGSHSLSLWPLQNGKPRMV